MNSQEFVQNAIRTESKPETLHVTAIAQHATMCAIRSVGDFVDIIKKAAFYNKPIDANALEQAMDDVMFRMGAIVGMAQHGLLQDEEKLREHAIQTLEGNDDGRAIFERNQKDIQERLPSKRLFHAVTGIASEAGEMAEALLKSMEGGSLDLVNFAEELFDVDWYMAIAHDEIQISQDETREKGIAKLKIRYADKFTADEAINRDVDAERAVLEGNA